MLTGEICQYITEYNEFMRQRQEIYERIKQICDMFNFTDYGWGKIKEQRKKEISELPFKFTQSEEFHKTWRNYKYLRDRVSSDEGRIKNNTSLTYMEQDKKMIELINYYTPKIEELETKLKELFICTSE